VQLCQEPSARLSAGWRDRRVMEKPGEWGGEPPDAIRWIMGPWGGAGRASRAERADARGAPAPLDGSSVMTLHS
jgi:hypothetical protein